MDGQRVHMRFDVAGPWDSGPQYRDGPARGGGGRTLSGIAAFVTATISTPSRTPRTEVP